MQLYVSRTRTRAPMDDATDTRLTYPSPSVSPPSLLLLSSLLSPLSLSPLALLSSRHLLYYCYYYHYHFTTSPPPPPPPPPPSTTTTTATHHHYHRRHPPPPPPPFFFPHIAVGLRDVARKETPILQHPCGELASNAHTYSPSQSLSHTVDSPFARPISLSIQFRRIGN